LTSGMTLEAWVNPSTVSSAWRDVIYKASDNYYLEGTSANGGVPATGGTFASGPLYGTALTAGDGHIWRRPMTASGSRSTQTASRLPVAPRPVTWRRQPMP